MPRAYTPNRIRLVDSRDIAKETFETFTKKAQKKEEELPFLWPLQMQHVGDSLAVAYASDKWKDDGDYELYKHLAESRNRALCAPGLLHQFDAERRALPTIGPMVGFGGVPMPKHFAKLALFEEIDLWLHVGADGSKPVLGKKNEGVVKVTLQHGLLGGGKIRWSVDGGRKDQPFLFVYTERKGKEPGGVHIIVVGEQLDIEADGIVG